MAGRRATRLAPIPLPQTRLFRIIVQDPTLRLRGRIVTARVPVPAERLDRGPRGYRVHVVDYNTTSRTLGTPVDLGRDEDAGDRFQHVGDTTLLKSPAFHAQNVYAIVMRTLARFELALGRRVPWGFWGHQLHVAPHAFAEANAFYSERDHGLLFGYIPAQKRRAAVYTCLSHDVIAHETTHALLDGLRDHFTDPGLPDQMAFHEGFADVVALLSVLAIPELVEAVLRLATIGVRRTRAGETVPARRLNEEWFKKSVLFGLAKELGAALATGGAARLTPSLARAQVLRRSATLHPDRRALSRPEFQEPHRRGEILVAAMLGSFAAVWARRLKDFEGMVPLRRVWEEGAEAANNLLTMAIRALDYCPPLDLTFGDYLSALLTADREILADDGLYKYRTGLRAQFRGWGISPASRDHVAEEGVWGPPTASVRADRIHFASMQYDSDEIFRFLWENHQPLGVYPDAYTRVVSVRPAVRLGLDGFVLRETIAEYVQQVDVQARELGRFDLRRPASMSPKQEIRLWGGGTLIFSEFGQLKYHVRKRLDHVGRQQAKLDYLWREAGEDGIGRLGARDTRVDWLALAELHRRRLAAALLG